jgi:hypothetical protein
MEKTIRTDTIKMITVFTANQKTQENQIYNGIYREPPNICPGLIFVRKIFLMGAYVQGPYILLLYL